MKAVKKIISLILVFCTLTSFCIVAGAGTASYAMDATVKGGYVTVDFIVKNAAGFMATQTKVTYDLNVLSVSSITDGDYKEQYQKVYGTNAVMTLYNKDTKGTIIPGIIIADKIQTDAVFAKAAKKCKIINPVTTANLVLFSVKFKIKDSEATETTVKWGSTSKVISLSGSSVDASAFSYVMDATVKSGYVTVDFIVENAAGLKSCDRGVTYDSDVLQAEQPKDGPYYDQYAKCDEEPLAEYNIKTPGVIKLGIVMINDIYTDADFAKEVKKYGQTFTPVTTEKLVLFTVKFKITDIEAAETTVKWGDTSKVITLSSSSATDECEHVYKTKVKAATFSSNGYVLNGCTSCGYSKKTTIAKIKSVTLSKTTLTYTGKAIKPTVTVKDSNGKTIASKYYTVKYSNNVNPTDKSSTAKVKITFKGNYSGTKTLTFNIKLGQVKISSASMSSSYKVTMKWKSVEGATKYEIYYYNPSAKAYKSDGTVSKTSFTQTWKGWKQVKFKVRAVYMVGSKVVAYGPWSSVVTVKRK